MYARVSYAPPTLSLISQSFVAYSRNNRLPKEGLLTEQSGYGCVTLDFNESLSTAMALISELADLQMLD